MELKESTIKEILGSKYFTEREKRMLRLSASGMVLQEIGSIFGITRERVRQILREKIPRKVAKHLQRNEIPSQSRE